MREAKMKQPDIEELPGFEELFHKSIQKALERMPVEERLAGLAPEQRLAGLAPEQVLGTFAPEQRLAGLATEQVILALPGEVLRMLSEEHIRSLPPDVQETIRKRLQGAAH
jgi:hypothetical protein